jgi:hypothetical protein
MQQRGTIKKATLSWVNAAAGKIEFSLSGTSQIGTAQPDNNVIFRISCSAGANTMAIDVPINVPVVAFQNVYVHCTGAGNLGTLTLS